MIFGSLLILGSFDMNLGVDVFYLLAYFIVVYMPPSASGGLPIRSLCISSRGSCIFTLFTVT